MNNTRCKPRENRRLGIYFRTLINEAERFTERPYS